MLDFSNWTNDCKIDFDILRLYDRELFRCVWTNSRLIRMWSLIYSQYYFRRENFIISETIFHHLSYLTIPVLLTSINWVDLISANYYGRKRRWKITSRKLLSNSFLSPLATYEKKKRKEKNSIGTNSKNSYKNVQILWKILFPCLAHYNSR